MLSEAACRPSTSSLLAPYPVNSRGGFPVKSALQGTDRNGHIASPALHTSSGPRCSVFRPIRFSHIRSSEIRQAHPASDGNEGVNAAGNAARNAARSAAGSAADYVDRHQEAERLQEQKTDTKLVSALEWDVVLSQQGSRKCVVGLLLFLALSSPPYAPLPLVSIQASSFSGLGTLVAPPTAAAAATAAEESAPTAAPDLSATPPARRSASPRVVLPPPPYLRPGEVAAERAAFEGRVDRAVRALEEGRRAQGEGRWADALALYTEVQESYPDLALSVYGKVGRALMEYEVGDVRTAITRLRVLSVEFKGYPEVHAALAAALYVEGGAAAAERQFTVATLLDQRYSDLAWLAAERHWPPTLLLHMKRFLLLQ